MFIYKIYYTRPGLNNNTHTVSVSAVDEYTAKFNFYQCNPGTLVSKVESKGLSVKEPCVVIHADFISKKILGRSVA